MDTFVDSSWYFFRYCSPGATDAAFRRADVDRWMPVGQYTGGVEHAILHLLYSRFFTKVLHDIGMVGFTEPFPRLMNQGQVIYGGASMSKTKGNIVEPMPIGQHLHPARHCQIPVQAGNGFISSGGARTRCG